MHRLVARLQPFAGMSHLDVAGGTGDVAFRVLGAMREDRARQLEGGASPAAVPLGEVHVCDINPDMLLEGRRKAARMAAAGARPDGAGSTKHASLQEPYVEDDTCMELLHAHGMGWQPAPC